MSSTVSYSIDFPPQMFFLINKNQIAKSNDQWNRIADLFLQHFQQNSQQK